MVFTSEFALPGQPIVITIIDRILAAIAIGVMAIGVMAIGVMTVGLFAGPTGAMASDTAIADPPEGVGNTLR
jgi:hypothetical protein